MLRGVLNDSKKRRWSTRFCLIWWAFRSDWNANNADWADFHGFFVENTEGVKSGVTKTNLLRRLLLQRMNDLKFIEFTQLSDEFFAFLLCDAFVKISI